MVSRRRSSATTTSLTRWKDGELGFKLLLTQTDKESLLALLQQKPQPTEPSLRISENFAFFEERVQAVGGDLTTLCKGLEELMIVDIALSRVHDNPQLIFESMNSTGRALSQADLIRNFILMGLGTVQQTLALRGALAADGVGLRTGGLRQALR